MLFLGEVPNISATIYSLLFFGCGRDVSRLGGAGVAHRPPVLLFSNLNQLCFGCFDPDAIFLDDKINMFGVS